jgi:hypothetical protein
MKLVKKITTYSGSDGAEWTEQSIYTHNGVNIVIYNISDNKTDKDYCQLTDTYSEQIDFIDVEFFGQLTIDNGFNFGMLYNSNEVVSLEDFVKHYYKLFN